MSIPKGLISTVFLSLSGVPLHAGAADLSCEQLVPAGGKMVCAGFEPNWAVELVCGGTTMTSNFIDAFSGASIVSTSGPVSISSQNPWVFATGTGVSGSIAYTPGACRDEADTIHDFTFTPTAAPGLSGPFYPFCCRIE